jgi:hypothetical protein
MTMTVSFGGKYVAFFALGWWGYNTLSFSAKALRKVPGFFWESIPSL